MNQDEFLDLVVRCQKVLVGFNIENLNVSGANLSGIVFKDCRLHSCRFELCNLSGARFERCASYGLGIEFCSLPGASFERGTLRNLVVYWSDLSDLVIADNCKVIEPCRIWNNRLSGAQFDNRIFDRYSSYIRHPKSASQIKEAIKTRKAELRAAQKQAQIESQRQAEENELAQLGALPVSELLRRFRDKPEDEKLSQVIDRKLRIAQS